MSCCSGSTTRAPETRLDDGLANMCERVANTRWQPSSQARVAGLANRSEVSAYRLDQLRSPLRCPQAEARPQNPRRPRVELEEISMKMRKYMAAVVGLAILGAGVGTAVASDDDGVTRLVGRAVLPANTFAAGHLSGTLIGAGPSTASCRPSPGSRCRESAPCSMPATGITGRCPTTAWDQRELAVLSAAPYRVRPTSRPRRVAAARCRSVEFHAAPRPGPRRFRSARHDATPGRY